MTDINPLLQEIEEDLERKKLEAMWKAYGPWVIICAILVVIGTGGYTAWLSWRTTEHQKATAGLIDIMADTKAEDAKKISALEEFATKNPSASQATFAKLQAAGLAVKEGDKKKAVELYNAIAADQSAESAFRQLADLLAVQTQMDDGDPVSLQQRLQPLLADNAPWRHSAKEDAAFLALRAGDKPKAIQLFTELSQDASAPRGINSRAGDMVRFLND